ncbi:MAG: enoyl-CoA hydratase-related protein [Anaerolineae bacterium]
MIEVKKVGVVGCGLMGSGVAQVCAQAGYPTLVREPTPELLEKGLSRISAFLGKGVARGKLSEAQREATWGRISGTTELSDLADCDLVIEAIIEDLEAKKALFVELDQMLKPEAILVSNTSSLPIALLASVTGRPARVAGLHFFYPAVINRLVEVVVAEGTSKEVADFLIDFSRWLGKVPIRVKDAPGFAVNRFFVPWANEAAKMLGEGLANVSTIDEAAREAFSIRMGPFALMNATGISIAYHSSLSLGRELGPFYEPAQVLRERLEAGQEWELEGEIDESAKKAVADRLLGVVFGIACQLVEEGVATKEDVDRGATIGLRWAKGPFALMNETGVREALSLVEAVAARSKGFLVPGLLREQAARGEPWVLRDVKLEIDGPIAIITMNRPEAMNALNGKVLAELKEAIAEVKGNEALRAVIITGEGNAFVAGADILEMKAKSLVEIRRFTYFGQSVLKGIEEMEKPVIAAINGFALGGGMELALACDIRLASREAKLGLPEVGLGIFPGMGGTQRLPRLIGRGRASELIFTGDMIGAEEAERIGLVNRVLSPQDLMKEARELAMKIASRAPIAVGRAKAAINKAMQTDLDTGLAYEIEAVSLTFGTEDKEEGMTAFIEGRKPEFKGK